MTIIPLPFTAPPLTKNDVRNMHFHTEAKKRAEIIQAASPYIRAVKPEPMKKTAVIILHWRMGSNHRRDGDGADPTKSALIDALVREGVLEDDSWRYVVHSGVSTHAPIPGKPGAMWLSISSPDEEMP